MKRALLLLVAILLSTYGCSGDSGTSPVIEEDIPLAADTIGTEGDTLKIDDFALIVPAGAFDSDIELTLYEANEDHGFGDNCVSRFFRLEGLPESFSESLTVRIGYQGSVGEDVLIALGEKTTFYSTVLDTSTGIAYDFYPATESSGFLEAIIPSPETNTLKQSVDPIAMNGTNRSFIAAIRDSKLEGSTDHFKYSYPLRLFGQVDNIGAYLEAAFDTVDAIGVGYSRRHWLWPATVSIWPSRSGTPVGTNLGAAGKLKITVDADFVTEDNLPELRALLGGIMVLTAQSIPNPADMVQGDNETWNAAVWAWFDEIFRDPAQFIRPRSFSGKEPYALQGIPVGVPSGSAQDYGIGWAPVVRSIVGANGTSIVGDIYEAMQTQNANPFHELFERLTEPAYNWFPQFVDQYLTGQIYGVDSALLLAQIPSQDKDTIGKAADTTGTFQRDADQLSARLYRILLNYALISENATMELKVTSTEIDDIYLDLFVYKAKDGVLEYLGAGSKVTVDNLKDLTIQGYDIVAVEVLSFVEAPFTETPHTQVTYRISTGPSFKSCLIRVGLDAIFQTEGAAKPDTSYLLPGWRAIGGFSGNTFSGEIDQGHHGENTTGSVTVTIDPITGEATSFSTSAVTTDSWGISRWGMTGSYLPATTYVPNDALEHRVEGTGTCSYINAYHWSYEPSVGNRQDVIGRICRANAGIEITFSKWE